MTDAAPPEGASAGFLLHRPKGVEKDALVLTHGAGGNANSALLVAFANAFACEGFLVLRYNLPFRQERPFGPPRPGAAAHDRAGLREAIATAGKLVPGRVFLGGHSYGGRQATILCADDPHITAGLLLLSYPLHPPRKPEQLRTQHWPQLHTAAMFVHGSRDPFGSLDELNAALTIIPGRKQLIAVEEAGHDLKTKSLSPATLAARVCGHFVKFHAED